MLSPVNFRTVQFKPLYYYFIALGTEAMVHKSVLFFKIAIQALVSIEVNYD